jgi:hypothetical protein
MLLLKSPHESDLVLPLISCSCLWCWIFRLWLWWVSEMWNLQYWRGRFYSTISLKNTFLNCLDAICVGFIYFSLQERENLLQCSLCGKYAHQSCVVPPIRDIILKEWACNLCKNKTVEYLPPRTNIIEQQKRFRTTGFIILCSITSFITTIVFN